MTARPFDLTALPRVARADFATARRIARRFGPGARHLSPTIAPFGRLSMTFSFLGPSLPPDETMTVWSLRRGDASGWLMIENIGALRVVAALLGIASPRISRPLRGAEVGMLAAAIAAVCRAVIPGTLLNHARRSEWSGAGLARLCVHLDSPTFRHQVFLDLPPSTIPPATPDHLAVEMMRRQLSIPLTVELASTTLPAAEWSNARVGDAVVFGPRPLTSASDELPGRLICGAYSALVDIGSNNTARVTELFTPRPRAPRVLMSDDTVRNHAESVIAGAPIEVVAECGRLTLPADEVMSMRPGTVLPLGFPGTPKIQLRVGGQLWADGELVDVEGQLGVRITALAND